MEFEQKNPDLLSTVERALRVLSIFNEQKSEYTLHEISNKLNLPKSMVFRTLHTLESMGYVLKNEKEKIYSLGFEIFRLGKVLGHNFPLTKIASPFMQELNDITKETICLVIPDLSSLRGVQIFNIETQHPIKYNVNMSTVGYLHSGASRKTILAHMEEGLINQVIQKIGLPKITENTITDPNDLLKELKQIKEQGYAISKGEAIADVFAVAAPIFNHEEEIMGSIGIYLPIYRLNGEESKLIKLIKSYSLKISSKLSYQQKNQMTQ